MVVGILWDDILLEGNFGGGYHPWKSALLERSKFLNKTMLKW